MKVNEPPLRNKVIIIFLYLSNHDVYFDLVLYFTVEAVENDVHK